MAKLSVLAGATSVSVNVFIQNSSSTTGAGLTGLVFNSGSLIAYYTFAGANATAVSISLVTLAAVNSAYSSGGFKELDSVHMPGAYRLDIPDAALAAASGRSVLIFLSGATNMAPLVLEVELTGWNNQDAVHGGMSALPNTAVTTNASLLTSGTGTDQLQVASGIASSDAKKINAVATTSVTAVSANVGTTQPVNFTGTAGAALVKGDTIDIGGTAQTARDLGASVLLSAGTGAGQLDFTSGVVKANLVQILATALTETAGQIAGAFKKLFDVAAPTLTCLDINQTGDSFARIGAAGAGLTALGDTRIANLDATVSSRTKPADTQAAVTSVVNPVTVGTNNDKTGYALTAAYDAAKTAAQAGDIMKLSSGTGANQIVLTSGQVTVGTNNDKAGYSLTQSFPANFSSLAIDSSGRIVLQPAQIVVKKNTALAKFPFLMVDSVDHITPKTGLTVTAQRSIDGGAFAGSANAVVEVANGIYTLDLAATDLNGTTIALKLTAAGADARYCTILTQP